MIIKVLENNESDIIIPAGDEYLLVDRAQAGFLLEKRIIRLEAGARVGYVMMVEATAKLESLQREWFVGADAELHDRYLWLAGVVGPVNLSMQVAESAKLDSRCLFIGEDQNWQCRADYNFEGRASWGRIKIDAMLSGKSHLGFDANLNVLASAQKSDTRVDMKLLLEEGSSSGGRLIPGLNIAANDVKAGHSASTFKLSSEDLFYLRSRGLSVLAIKKLLANSLVGNIVLGLNSDALKDEILTMVQKAYE